MNPSAILLGLGRSNRAMALHLAKQGVFLDCYDAKPFASHCTFFDSLPNGSYRYNDSVTQNDTPFHAEDFPKGTPLFRTPAIRPDCKLIQNALAHGAVLTSEAEYVLSHAPCPIFGITGSSGKTTTSSLCAHLLRQSGRSVFLGGNIGTPLCDRLEQMKENDFCVMELSSFQLMNLTVSPTVAIITNLSPNHLDYHRSMEEYKWAKAQIFSNAPIKTVILNADDPACRSYAECLPQGVECRFFGHGYDPAYTVYEKDGILFVKGVPYLFTKEIPLPGKHNLENVMAAVALCFDRLTQTQIQQAICSFSPVPHRLQHIATKNGVAYYNSSIDSTPSRTICALSALPNYHKKIHLLLGGYDKHLDFSSLAEPVADDCCGVYLCGATAQKIKTALSRASNPPPLFLESDLKSAILHATQRAKAGEAVLLSPACASFDAFENFEQRGQFFCQTVMRLKG